MPDKLDLRAHLDATRNSSISDRVSTFPKLLASVSKNYGRCFRAAQGLGPQPLQWVKAAKPDNSEQQAKELADAKGEVLKLAKRPY